MTRIDPNAINRVAQALGTASAERKRKNASAATTAPNEKNHSRSAQLIALVTARLGKIERPDSLSDEEILTILVQETLAMEFGPDITLHPAFAEVVAKITRTLDGLVDPRPWLHNEQPSSGT